MDLAILIDTIYQAKTNSDRAELVNDLTQTINQQKVVTLSNLKRIFLLLEQLIFDVNPSPLIQAGNMLCLTLIEHLLPSELEVYFPAILKIVIKNLSSETLQIRK